MLEHVVVGVDVGGTKILSLAVAIDPDNGAYTVLDEHVASTPDTAEGLIAAIINGVGQVAGERRPVAVGVGVPGFIDRSGVARQAPNLKAAVGVDVAAALRERLGVAVRVDNDANCAAWASYRLDAPEMDTVVAITLGTGIGGGIVVDGKLVRGANGFAGEPGHMVVDPAGPLCVCGQRGCWEMWASGKGFGRIAQLAAIAGELPLIVERAATLDAVTGHTVTAALRSEDPSVAAEASLVLERYAGWVAVGVVNLVNLLDPGCVIFSGGIVAEGDELIERIRTAVASYPTMAGGRTPDLRISAVGPRAGAVGAGLLAGEDMAAR